MSNDTKTTIEWYKDNGNEPPFNPDGLCLKVCRTARDIDAVYPSAVAAQEATPRDDRVYDISKITRGMVIYFDDPRDSNPYGHIVTVHGWVKGSPRKSLHDILVWSNSVVAGKLVMTRADFYPKFWGDMFQFAATSLNGVDLDLPDRKAKKKPALDKATNIKNAIEDLQKAVKYHDDAGHPRLVRALRRDIANLRDIIKEFS